MQYEKCSLTSRCLDVTQCTHIIFHNVLLFVRRNINSSVLTILSMSQCNYYTVKGRTETFRSSYPSSVKLWNFLDVCDRTLTYVDCLMKKTEATFLYHGSRKYSVEHAQLRMKCMLCSLQRVLQAHSRGLESYLLQCPLYFQARNKMLNDIGQLSTFHISGDLLLYAAVELDYMPLTVKYLLLSMIILEKLADCDVISPTLLYLLVKCRM